MSKESGVGVVPNWNYNWETRRRTQLFVGLGFDTTVNLGPVPAQIGVELHYNLARNDVLNPQWQLRVVLTPVVPAPAWAGRALFGNCRAASVEWREPRQGPDFPAGADYA